MQLEGEGGGGGRKKKEGEKGKRLWGPLTAFYSLPIFPACATASRKKKETKKKKGKKKGGEKGGRGGRTSPSQQPQLDYY